MQVKVSNGNSTGMFLLIKQGDTGSAVESWNLWFLGHWMPFLLL